MLAELFRYFTLRCPPWARRLGLTYEHVAITQRHRRVSAAWAPHLAASKAAILAGAERCRQRRRVLVIGAGDCRDVPVAELAAQFDTVVLTDVVLGPELRRLARHSRGRVRAEIWDATGVLAQLAAGWGRLSAVEMETLFAHGDAGAPPGGEADLVVSANCLSQLGLVPAERFFGKAADKGWSARCAAAAAGQHLRWLAGRSGVRVLLADRSRLDLDAQENELRREAMPGMAQVRVPDRSWRWRLAPIPEWSQDFHRVHEVGAWIDGR